MAETEFHKGKESATKRLQNYLIGFLLNTHKNYPYICRIIICVTIYLMRKFILCVFATASIIALISSCSSKTKVEEPDQPSYEVLTYVWDGGEVIPDPTLITAINYAFANVNDTRDGIKINNEPRFRSIIDLKKQNPDLKILLSVGGNCASGFSEMAADSLKRLAFADDCARVIREYGIDGIDFDWEFPCWEGGRPDDFINYAKLLVAVRNSIGNEKLLTLAAGGDLNGLDVNNVGPMLEQLDYVNVMAYDLGGQAPWHHTALYRSPNTGWRCVDEVVEDYVAHGVPYEKMMLGLGFYGRGDDNYFTGWTNSETAKPYGDLTEQWDSIACVPYIADTNGTLVCGYENPRSIEIKCDYIKDKGFRGAMCWRTELDLDSLKLARTVARSLLGVE